MVSDNRGAWVRGLMVAVVGMGVLIVAGVVVLVGVLVSRMSSVPSPIASAGSAIAAATLEEPGGSRIVGVSMGTDRLAIQLGGGGPDRVVIVDTRLGRVVGRVALAQ